MQIVFVAFQVLRTSSPPENEEELVVLGNFCRISPQRSASQR